MARTHEPLGLTLLVQGPDDWEHARDLRLEMLADSPLAFLERHGDALERSDDAWRELHLRRLAPNSRSVALADDTGRWLGQMVVIDDRPSGRAWLVAVYLTPALRGTRAAAAMLEAVVDWARERGKDALWLEVHEHNPRAIAFYTRHGFVDTGGRRPYPLDESADEVEMRLDL
ncbi:GNAT family N-acetyltransferase [Aestuariimicrobium ganziense]|uniref:GNAT family N-acetyltransferase n=1 Tax=Aestuariimicrobium ganziense TaxID=2773677 RepID=UPI001944E57C|nr:GNAT family N-acetyltransferase [Aestuariimicrobium ganziense]